jgi:hypothetical protein
LALVSFPRDDPGIPAISAFMDLVSGEQWWATAESGLSEAYGAFLVAHKDALLVYGKEMGAQHVSSRISSERETDRIRLQWRRVSLRRP